MANEKKDHPSPLHYNPLLNYKIHGGVLTCAKREDKIDLLPGP